MQPIDIIKHYLNTELFPFSANGSLNMEQIKKNARNEYYLYYGAASTFMQSIPANARLKIKLMPTVYNTPWLLVPPVKYQVHKKQNESMFLVLLISNVSNSSLNESFKQHQHYTPSYKYEPRATGCQCVKWPAQKVIHLG